MPKILELKVVDDQLWARIPKFDTEQPVTLWTTAEKERLIREVREQCIDAILAKID